ncbi:hypothetical protein ACHHRT_08060 [Desulfurivibrio sp. D14AmB]|uniref:hypothetical protein n=1 Tax=Desulfurivibrio sp. D14AmB TaxID=3374370 RepID=UPI00376EDD6E
MHRETVREQSIAIRAGDARLIDPLFHQLRLWMKDQHGNDYLYTLAEKGIGAILLDSIQTPFNLHDSADNLQGRLAETSIYLSETGRAGTIQHLDYLV